MAATVELKYALMEPSLILFSISGFTQYFTRSLILSFLITIVTAAPFRHVSKAASTAEFAAPTTNTFLKSIKVRVFIIMLYFIKLFSFYIQQIRNIVKAGTDNNVGSSVFLLRSCNGKMLIFFFYINHLFKKLNMQAAGYCHSAVIFQSFISGGLCIIADKRNTADLKPFTGTEERHVNRVVV